MCTPLAPQCFELFDRGFEVYFELIVSVDPNLFYELPHNHLLAFKCAALEHIGPGQDSVVLFLDVLGSFICIVNKSLRRVNLGIQLFDFHLCLLNQFTEQFLVPGTFALNGFINLALIAGQFLLLL